MPYKFVDDGYPEAREFEDNYVPVMPRPRSPPAPPPAAEAPPSPRPAGRRMMRAGNTTCSPRFRLAWPFRWS